MVVKRLWLAGLAALLAGCKESLAPAPILPPCNGSGLVINPPAGQYASVDPGPMYGCALFNPNSSGSLIEYLLVLQSASGTPNDSASFNLVGAAATAAGGAPTPVASTARPAALGPAEQFHLFLRQSERRRSYPVTSRPPRAPAAHLAAQAPPPPRRLLTASDSGNVFAFKVCGDLKCDSLPTVVATLMKIGQHIAIFVDTNAPQPGVSQADLDTLREVFDQRLYGIDRGAFGNESDIDANSVVMVLMTNEVNQLVPASQCSTSGYVAGYFFGADIDPFFRTTYNNGEVFYSLVADPGGTLSCAHSVAQVKGTVPVTFIHEFQHMISYNQHVLVRGGAAEVLWLNEALSHYAEERGGRSFLPSDTLTYCRYVGGDLYNSAQYFAAPEDYFLVDTSGIGGLAERGGYWLFLRYLIDQYATDTSLAALDVFTKKLDLTNLTGLANVQQQTGTAFTTLVTRWSLANYVSDLPGFTAPSQLKYKMWRFRTDYGTLKTACAPVLNTGQLPSTLPLVPGVGTASGVNLSGVLRAGTGTYFRAQQNAGTPGFTLLLSDATGRRLLPSLVPRLNVIRIQ
jgi:hypothetical protein